jgi:hypothetical protein
MESFDLTRESDRLALVDRVFVYPAEPHRRKHGPGGYTDYESYRDWLRDEFSYRCVFSLVREAWSPSSFHIDHLQPQALRPDLTREYDNLLYIAGQLNLIRGKRPLEDPCRVGLGNCLFVHPKGERIGEIEARNTTGERIIRVLRLDSEDATQMRRGWLGILRSVAQTDEALFRGFIGYPKNLPDLRPSAKRPTRNNRPTGLKQSAFVCREAGLLAEWY